VRFESSWAELSRKFSRNFSYWHDSALSERAERVRPARVHQLLVAEELRFHQRIWQRSAIYSDEQAVVAPALLMNIAI
jgi:hypothetical protein